MTLPISIEQLLSLKRRITAEYVPTKDNMKFECST